MNAVQGSLFDQAETIGLGELAGATVRRELTAGAWVDVRAGWLSGSDVLFETLRTAVGWQAERRRMYDRVVDVPRLVRFYGERERWPDPLLCRMRKVLSEYYFPELGEPFATAGMCLYRDGRDSVAWHGDLVGRSRERDTMVAIVSLGAPRPLALRPRGGGSSLRFVVGHGDLLVMGGSCQRTWEHAIPKLPGTCGPRISVQFRTAGVR